MLYNNDRKYFEIKKQILKKLGLILKEKKAARGLTKKKSNDWLNIKKKPVAEPPKLEEKKKLTEEEKQFINSEEADEIVFETLEKW